MMRFTKGSRNEYQSSGSDNTAINKPPDTVIAAPAGGPLVFVAAPPVLVEDAEELVFA